MRYETGGPATIDTGLVLIELPVVAGVAAGRITDTVSWAEFPQAGEAVAARASVVVTGVVNRETPARAEQVVAAENRLTTF